MPTKEYSDHTIAPCTDTVEEKSAIVAWADKHVRLQSLSAGQAPRPQGRRGKQKCSPLWSRA